MKKRGLIFLAGMFLLSLAVILTGCGGGGDSSTTYTVGGNVTGLASGESLVLQNNGGDDLMVTANGAFTFVTALADGAAYDVTVKTQPASNLCIADVPNGTVSSAVTVNVTCVAVVTINGTVVYSPDSGADVPLAGIPIEARNPSDDSVINSTTTNTAGAFSVTVPSNRDFYLHATGKTIGSMTYVSDNYQIENEQADRTINFYLIDTETLSTVVATIGIDTAKDAIFALGVVDNNGDGIADVTVSASQAVSNIWYHQLDDSFSATGSTTKAGEPSVIGNISSPGANGTYTFTLSPETAGYTIDTTFRLRLIPGEISEAIEP